MRQRTFFLQQAIERSIERLQVFCPPEGYFLAFSGGKDSIVLKRLADMAGVKYDAHFHRTTVDPPEVIRFTKQYHQDVILDRPSTSMFKLIVEQGCPPLRIMRYCCRIFKEAHGMGRVVLTGVRWAESRVRRKRKFVDQCPSKAKVMVHPILDWSHEEVWDFIETEQLPYCGLYNEGFKRIGCILCPSASHRVRLREVDRWPRFYSAYLKCFEKMLLERDRRKKPTKWNSAEEVMHWWLYEDSKVVVDDSHQPSLFE